MIWWARGKQLRRKTLVRLLKSEMSLNLLLCLNFILNSSAYRELVKLQFSRNECSSLIMGFLRFNNFNLSSKLMKNTTHSFIDDKVN